jgi:hypothetical protein
MKKFTVISACALAYLTMQAAELEGVRYGGYTTNAVPQGFSILAVPFSGFDTNSFTTTNLSLSALISTNGLTIEDRLIAFNEATTNYYYYALTSGGWSALNVAQIGTVSTNYVVIVNNPPALSNVLKAQGYAFWLRTQNSTTAYLQGVVDENETSVAIASNSWTLVGNALPSALDLNSSTFTNANTWFTPYSPVTGPGDEIHVVVNGSNYQQNVFFKGSWKLLENGQPTTPSTVPAGAGVWFYRRGTNVTFKLQ